MTHQTLAAGRPLRLRIRKEGDTTTRSAVVAGDLSHGTCSIDGLVPSSNCSRSMCSAISSTISTRVGSSIQATGESDAIAASTLIENELIASTSISCRYVLMSVTLYRRMCLVPARSARYCMPARTSRLCFCCTRPRHTSGTESAAKRQSEDECCGYFSHGGQITTTRWPVSIRRPSGHRSWRRGL